VILGFRREVDKKCASLGNYAAISVKFLPTFRDNLSAPFFRDKEPLIFLTPEKGTDRLSRNVGKKLPLLDA